MNFPLSFVEECANIVVTETKMVAIWEASADLAVAVYKDRYVYRRDPFVQLQIIKPIRH